jgi:hypothetical protein
MTRFLFLLGILAPLLCARPALALPEETWVVAVGNNRGDAEDIQLLYAERDAKELADVLRTEGHIASDRVRVLLDEPAETVRRTLLEVSAAIQARKQEAAKPTALLFFYSGHADADALHLRTSRLPVEELRGLITAAPVAMRLLIVDACRSGAVTRVKGLKPAAEFDINLAEPAGAEGMAIISSSTAGEWSQESDRLRGSFFSHHLVNALRGAADRNGDGRITLSEAYEYTYGQTLRSSGRTLTLQHPTYSYAVKGTGEIVLTTPGEHGGATGRLRLAAASLYLVTEEREAGAVVAEVATTRSQAVLSLPRGRYFVQQRGRDEFREYQVALGLGGEVALESLDYRAVRYDRLVRKRGGARSRTHGIELLAGVRGPMLDGDGATPLLSLGYRLDLPWLTAGLRLRGATTSVASLDPDLPRRHNELGLALTVQRYIDLPWFSISFGLAVEGSYHVQTFDPSVRQVDSRTALAIGFFGLLAVERHLFQGLALRLEGGPLALVFPRAQIMNGAPAGGAIGSTVTGFFAGGFAWRF